jgi:phenylpropionate dioxygenase-like ring-hydroxylating dioxygenase large terminal subunit
MGPPERKPVLPLYDIVEALEPDEYLVADGTSLGAGGDVIIPCNWTHHMDNVPDTYHVAILHGSHSGTQFIDQMAIMPQVDWAYSERGMKTISSRKRPDGKTLMRVTEGLMPNIRIIPDPRIPASERCDAVGWLMPIDETHYRLYRVLRKKKGRPDRARAHPGGRDWFSMTEEEHQKYPDDYEAQVGQGPATLHSEEHLATTDRGVVMMRRLLQRQMDDVEAGKDPIGVVFDERAAMVRVESGNFIVDA